MTRVIVPRRTPHATFSTMLSLPPFLRKLFGFGDPAPAKPMPSGGGAAAPVAAAPMAPISSTLPRGVRNCNPGDIDRDGTVWQGMAADQSGDDRFVVFVSAEYGIRALVRILISYQENDHCTTIRQMINRWAPRTENNTGAYVSFVAGRMGISADTPFDIHVWTFCALMTEAIIAQECENYAYPIATVDAALNLAGVFKPALEA